MTRNPTPEMLVEELNIAAEYAGCEVEFGLKPSEQEGCCIVTWGAVGAPHESHPHQREVNVRLAFGRARNLPDKATPDHFAELLSWATPEKGLAKTFSFVTLPGTLPGSRGAP